jgi:hypothetical protein
VFSHAANATTKCCHSTQKPVKSPPRHGAKAYEQAANAANGVSVAEVVAVFFVVRHPPF